MRNGGNSNCPVSLGAPIDLAPSVKTAITYVYKSTQPAPAQSGGKWPAERMDHRRSMTGSH